MTPEEIARQKIDSALKEADWSVQDPAQVNLQASRRVAIREFPLKRGHGYADYLLYVNGKAKIRDFKSEWHFHQRDGHSSVGVGYFHP